MEQYGRTNLRSGSQEVVQIYVDGLSALLDSRTAALEDAERVVSSIRAEIKDISGRLKKAKIDLEKINAAPEQDAVYPEGRGLPSSLDMSERDLTNVLDNDGLSTSEKIRRVARYVLERRQPLKRRSLLKAVTEAGLIIEAADPADTLRKALERDTGFTKDTHGYWLSRQSMINPSA